MFQTLESRRMFSVSAAASAHTLYVWGDANSNGINIEKSGADLVVTQYNGSGYVELFRANDAYVTAIKMYGYAGSDTLTVKDNVTDPATIMGGKGVDFLQGGGGTSTLWGHGNLPGDANFDPATDDGSADMLASGKGATYSYGQKGNDTFYTDTNAVGSGLDIMTGGDGNDTFYVSGHGANAYAIGEAGSDSFIPAQNATQTSSFYGGAGWDAVTYRAWTVPVFVQPDGVGYSGWRYGAPRKNILQPDVEFVQGSELADQFVGSSGDNTFYGWGGNDVMSGNGGNDLLSGQAGNDSLYGDAGNDYVVGGEGNDVLYGGTGNDSVYGNQGQDDIHGGAGNDLLLGQEDSDWIYGDEGNDTLVGGLGSDYLVSHDGIFGNDLIYGDNQDGSGGYGSFDVAYIDRKVFQDVVTGVESISA